MDLKLITLNNFSFPKSEQEPFIDLVDKILAITKDNNYLENPAKQAKACLSEDSCSQAKEYEHQIDQMVYKLYGLTKDEIKIIERFDNG